MDRLDPARIRAIDEQMQCHLDYCWAVTSREVGACYAERMVAVCRKTVWGSGKDSIEAGADAESKPGCPPIHELTFVYVPPEDLGTSDEPEWPTGPSLRRLRTDEAGPDGDD